MESWLDGTTIPDPAALKSIEAKAAEITKIVVPAAPGEPPLLVEARKWIGVHEIVGPKHNSTILRMWEAIKAPFRNDEVPWCAGFVGFCIENLNQRSTRSAGARSYAQYGIKLAMPAPGCIVVFWRGTPAGYSGHVGIVVGYDARGFLLVLGGNQSDMVCIRAFSTLRVLTYRWPSWEMRAPGSMKVVKATGSLATKES